MKNSTEQQNRKLLKGVNKDLQGVTPDDKTNLGRSNKARPQIESVRNNPNNPKKAPRPTQLNPGATKNKTSKKEHLKQFKKAPSDEVLGVLLDQKTGNQFYVSLIDNFRYNGIDYAIMYNYQAGQMIGSKPEILIMRIYHDGKKQYFTSIRDKTELNTIFEVFYSRFEQSL